MEALISKNTEPSMNLSTSITQPLFEKKIDFKDQVLTIGSCFSETIGEYLLQNKFDVLNNQFGTVYNPISIFRILRNTVKNEFSSDGQVQNGEVYRHFDFHSDLSALSGNELDLMITDRIQNAHQFLKRSKWLIITFGTAYIYNLKSSGQTVANCHKVPQQQFNKESLSTEQILSDFDELYNCLRAFNSGLNLIVAVSPVRHTKDGLENNSYSKSILRVTCEELKKSYENIHYFPSYEIMMDDLRDYRFYSEDLIHPSQMAKDYIWEVFIKAFLTEADQSILKKWKSVQRALEHRPRFKETNSHKEFLQRTLDKLYLLNGSIDLKSEIEELSLQLNE